MIWDNLFKDKGAKTHKEKNNLNFPLFISIIESINSNCLKQESPNPCNLTDKSYQIMKAEILPISTLPFKNKNRNNTSLCYLSIVLITNPNKHLIRKLHANSSGDHKCKSCQQNISKSNKNDLSQLCTLHLQAKRKKCTLSYQKQKEVMQDIQQSFKTENLSKLEVERKFPEFIIFTKPPQLTSCIMVKNTKFSH